MEIIRSWNVPGAFKNIIVVKYDYDLQIFTVDYIGWLVSHDTTLSEAELLVANNTIIATNCHGYDKHVFRAITTYPFLSVEITANSTDCGYSPPPPPPTPTPDNPPVVPDTANWIAYQIRFKNVEEQIVEATIFDMETYAEGRTIEYRPLKPSGEPVRLECIDNDENKFTPIRAKQCIIEFNSSTKISSATFARGQDNRWYVETKVNGQIKFKGFLVLNDIQEDFLSPPNIVSLTATDNIGLLRDLPLTNFDGISPIVVRPKSPYRWMDYLAWALSKTSLRLPINVQHNLRHQHSPGQPFFTNTYYDPKTFEDEIGTCINCYEVLETLLGEECELFQRNGEWWVQRVDELDNRDRYFWKISADLAAVTDSIETFDKTIKKDQDIKWVDRTAYNTFERAHSSVKETFRFEYPKEIIDNIDFARGDQILVVVTPPEEKHYHLDDWTFKTGFPYNTTSVQSSAYIKRVFNEFDVEVERYLVLTKQINANQNSNHVESNAVPIHYKDRFDISIDYKMSENRPPFTQSVFLMTVRIEGEGKKYWLGRGTSGKDQWYLTDANLSNNSTFAENPINFTIADERDWQTLTYQAPPAPVNGNVYVTLHAMNTREDFTQDNVDVHYSNLRFTYYPYIMGTYQKFKGQSWQVSQPGDYKAKRDKEVFVSDSPKKLFKGAMMYFDSPSGEYRLTGKWYDYSLSPAVVPDEADMKPYGWFQAQSVWNQYRRVMRIFDGGLYGLADSDLPDLIHRYILNDPSAHTRLRYFMCLHFSMSLKTCTWSAYFVEVFKTDEEKIYTDDTEFKYVESR